MNAPTTPHTQPLPGITCMRFSLLRFRSPLLSESQLFSLPMGTEMFHFPTFPPHTLFHSDAGNRTQLRLGSPIRTPPDHSSVANSPGLIAGSNVLHRLLMPRHPPCALHSLPNTNTQQKQQRHTLQKQTPTHDQPHPTNKRGAQGQQCGRCSRPLSRNQTTRDPPGPTATQPGHRVLMPQNPNSVPENHTHQRPTRVPHPTRERARAVLADRPPTRGSFVDDSTIRTPPWPTEQTPVPASPTGGGCVLLRKEVIQPHLPVRLPCYDFVPIASPTFDHSLHKGWAVGFGCCRLS